MSSNLREQSPPLLSDSLLLSTTITLIVCHKFVSLPALEIASYNFSRSIKFCEQEICSSIYTRKWRFPEPPSLRFLFLISFSRIVKFHENTFRCFILFWFFEKSMVKKQLRKLLGVVATHCKFLEYFVWSLYFMTIFASFHYYIACMCDFVIKIFCPERT